MRHKFHCAHITTLAIALIFLLTPPLHARKKKDNPPEFLHSEFASLGVEEIYILPAVDHRQDKDFEGKFQKPLLQGIRGKLKRKKYVSHLPGWDATVDVTEDQVAHPSPALIKSLAPEGSKWLILPVLLKFERHTNIASKGVASLRVYLFDTQTGDLIWQDSGDATVKVGVFLTFAAGHDAVLIAAQQAMDSFPDSEKKKRRH